MKSEPHINDSCSSQPPNFLSKLNCSFRNQGRGRISDLKKKKLKKAKLLSFFFHLEIPIRSLSFPHLGPPCFSPATQSVTTNLRSSPVHKLCSTLPRTGLSFMQKIWRSQWSGEGSPLVKSNKRKPPLLLPWERQLSRLRTMLFWLHFCP